MEQLTATSISQIDKCRHDFEEKFAADLVNQSFRNIVSRAIPLKEGESEKINNPEFKEKLSGLLTNVSKELVDNFHKVGSFDTGSLFSSMVSSITDSVSLEADYRQRRLIQDIQLGRVKQDHASLSQAIESTFAGNEFRSEECEKRYVNELKFVLSREDAEDVIDRIKNDVKDAIEETEAKNELVEGTTQEIIDYKNEIAPPDDEYKDPNDTNANDPLSSDADPNFSDPNAQSADPNVPGEPATTDVSDDGMQGGDTDNPGGDDQIYEDEGGDDGLGSDPTSTGDPSMDANADSQGDDPSAPTDPADPSDTATGDDGGEPMSDAGDDIGGDPSSQTDDGTGDDMNPPGEDGASTVPDNADAPGGEDGIIDQNDVGKDIGTADPAGPEGDPMSAGVDNGLPNGNGNASNNNTGGITININGANLGKTKESLRFLNEESLGEKTIPLHPRTFNNMKLPDVNELASECCNVMSFGLSNKFKERMDMLSFAIKNDKSISEESKNAIIEKKNELGKTIANALDESKALKKSMEMAGISSQGLTRTTESTLAIARNIITRFLAKTQFVSVNPRPWNSKENVIANAFDIVQLRQHIAKQKNPDNAEVEDLFARENLFYHNLINYDDPEVKKEASAIIDLSLLNFRKAMSPNFITDYKIKAWELNVGPKTNLEINKEISKRVEAKFKELWRRDLNDTEKSIVNAVTNEDDVTEIIPTPYEKFMVTMGKESLLAKSSENNKNLTISDDEKKSIEWKSRLLTTVYKACESFGLYKEYDMDSFIKFSRLVGLV